MNKKLAAILAFCMLLFAVSTVLIIVSNGKHRQPTVSDETLNSLTSEDTSSADTSLNSTDLSQTSADQDTYASGTLPAADSSPAKDDASVSAGSGVSSTGISHSSAAMQSHNNNKQEVNNVPVTTKTETSNNSVQTQQTKPQTQAQTKPQTQVQTNPQTQIQTRPQTTQIQTRPQTTQIQTKPQTQQSVTTQPVHSELPPTGGQSQFNSYQTEVLRLVNEARAENGLSSLSLDLTLSNAAYKRSTELPQSFSHSRPDGSSCFTVLGEYGISARTMGENIAWGQRSASEVVTGWLNSPSHRENIMNSSFTTLGVGIYENSNGTKYWTQLFTG